MSIKQAFSKVLASPRKVASSLDWKKASGSVMSLIVHKDRLELAVASHPSYEEPIQPLPSIPLKLVTVNNRKVLKQKVLDELSTIVKSYNVCGMIVSWPVQKEGWCGKPCGMTLHVMDQLSTDTTILQAGRPVCLWDPEHHCDPEDVWGRAPIYGVPTNKTLHIASEEQYDEPHSHYASSAEAASEIWNDFCRSQWPDLYEQEPISMFSMNGTSAQVEQHCSAKTSDNHTFDPSLFQDREQQQSSDYEKVLSSL